MNEEYCYEIWYDHCCVGSDGEYYDPEDAYEEAVEHVIWIINDWADDDLTVKDFEIRVMEQ